MAGKATNKKQSDPKVKAPDTALFPYDSEDMGESQNLGLTAQKMAYRLGIVPPARISALKKKARREDNGDEEGWTGSA